MIPYSLLYSTSLSYSPTPASNPTILRTSPAVIPIECHYLRKDNVSSRAIKLTWVPFSSTLSVERLDFSLHLMNGYTALPHNIFAHGALRRGWTTNLVRRLLGAGGQRKPVPVSAESRRLSCLLHSVLT
ncbi:zona pellucida sperm-binding protein 3-like [Mauremys reevesii]|uniref:zona pellucida sperm-binding protein 3-like n=1 Tax=Mauremys reevesii TaxID=260615 RepID=UPI00193F0EA2|nr:zona pellucida sperm-binding protein 3-like [Mauremys reevesii]